MNVLCLGFFVVFVLSLSRSFSPGNQEPLSQGYNGNGSDAVQIFICRYFFLPRVLIAYPSKSTSCINAPANEIYIFVQDKLLKMQHFSPWFKWKGLFSSNINPQILVVTMECCSSLIHNCETWCLSPVVVPLFL